MLLELAGDAVVGLLSGLLLVAFDVDESSATTLGAILTGAVEVETTGLDWLIAEELDTELVTSVIMLKQ